MNASADSLKLIFRFPSWIGTVIASSVIKREVLMESISMRRKEKLVTDLKVIHEVIHRAEVCRLGLVDGSKPYIVPLSFGFDGTHIYFHSAREGRKINVLQKNSCVCLEFEQNIGLLKAEKPCKWGFRYLTVICSGTVEPVRDFDEKRKALNLILRHYDPDWVDSTFTEQELSPVLVFKVTLEEMTGKISGMEI
jgi:nitroimidazol reductase NimA-like FMN-containing flavoprotein (pyridoxamine 5'-phosphate oxidase superfamily)